MTSSVTPFGVASFPNLAQPKAPAPGLDPRYSVNLIFDAEAQKTPEFAAMKKAVMAAATEKFGAQAADMIRKGQLRLPFRPVAEKSQYAGYDCEGGVFVNFWTKRIPGVIDGANNDLDPMNLYPGALARATYTAFGYANSGNKGVSFQLNNVQAVDLTKPRLDGSKAAKDDFAPIPGYAPAPASPHAMPGVDSVDEDEDVIPF